jgi:tetratricopeptide (TPR) repeat protein
MKLFKRKSKIDPALARYPAAMAELLELGDTDDEIDYASMAAQLREYTPDLIRLVLDEDFANREEDDPAALAPFHALEVLAILGPAEAAEPLLACLAWETDWANGELVRAYAGIGPVAVPPLLAYLDDGSHEPLHRALAADALHAIAEAHPAAREHIVDALTRFLDRPTAADSAEEELATAFAISDLTDLHATSAYDAIARAFAEDRVDTQILDLEFVEQEWGMRPKPNYTVLTPRQEPGVHLLLKCMACGRERQHVFPTVYCDIPTLRDEEKRAKFDPLIIPQRVTCPKCGAVDQYELGTMAELAITTALLARNKPELDMLRPDQQIQFITFTTRWGAMHPVEADARYQKELAKKPNDADLHVGYANLRRFLGYYEEALAEYERAVAIDPNYVEAWVGQAEMAGERKDAAEATRCWQEVLKLASRRSATSLEHAGFAQVAEASLALLRRGIIPDIKPTSFDAPDEDPTPTYRPVPDGRQKIGRNEPCPCGSGKKYKHCHGRK